jgi:hypothetical protein
VKLGRSFFALCASLSLVLAACNGLGVSRSGSSDVGITSDTILLGSTDPLSGPAAAYGTIPKASDAYFHYVNEAV